MKKKAGVQANSKTTPKENKATASKPGANPKKFIEGVVKKTEKKSTAKKGTKKW